MLFRAYMHYLNKYFADMIKRFKCYNLNQDLLMNDIVNSMNPTGNYKIYCRFPGVSLL